MTGKRDKIAATADGLFYREGFAATGIDRVVAEAGVALGTLYRHFRGRRELIVGALAHREAAYFAALDAAAEGKRGAERVLSLFDGLAGWAERNGGNGCLFLRAASAHPGDAAIRGRVAVHKRACLALARKRLAEGGWSEDAAARLAPMILVLLEGAVATSGALGTAGAKRAARAAAQALLQADPPGPR